MYIIKVRLGHRSSDFRFRMRKLIHEMMNVNRPILYTPDPGWSPEADVYETAGEVVFVLNVAGVQREDIDVSFHENYLKVKGRRKMDLQNSSPLRYHQLEIGHGEFERIFRIPTPIDADSIEASCSDGILTIRMTKGRKIRVSEE